jgi:hypothetical protein
MDRTAFTEPQCLYKCAILHESVGSDILSLLHKLNADSIKGNTFSSKMLKVNLFSEGAEVEIVLYFRCVVLTFSKHFGLI